MHGKVAGHGNHWRPLWGDQYDPERDVLRWVRRTLVRPGRRDVRDLADRRRLDVAFTSDSGLGLCVALCGDTVLTAFPHVRGGAAALVRVREVVQWQNGIEAQVNADVNGRGVAFFALDAYCHRARYRAEAEVRVVLSALLYRGCIHNEGSEPTWRSLAGEHAGSLAFDIDDVALEARVTAVSPVEALGLNLLRCTVALPWLSAPLPVYLRPERLDPAPERSVVDRLLGRWPLEGRWLSGQAWLAGYLAEGSRAAP